MNVYEQALHIKYCWSRRFVIIFCCLLLFPIFFSDLSAERKVYDIFLQNSKPRRTSADLQGIARRDDPEMGEVLMRLLRYGMSLLHL